MWSEVVNTDPGSQSESGMMPQQAASVPDPGLRCTVRRSPPREDARAPAPGSAPARVLRPGPGRSPWRGPRSTLTEELCHDLRAPAQRDALLPGELLRHH